MALPNIFIKEISEQIIQRINQLTVDAQPLWGKMSVDKMLGHCNVTYDLIFEPDKYPKPNFLKKFLLKSFVKKFVVNEVNYPQSSPTAKEFIVKEDKNFELEKQKLITAIHKVQMLGSSHFEGKESNSFGTLTAIEWNNMFYKHLDHHLKQFGL